MSLSPAAAVALTTIPASYDLAFASVALPSSYGIYKVNTRGGGSTWVQGRVTLNIVNNRLNSVTVRRNGEKTVNIRAGRLSRIGISANSDDTAIYNAFAR